MCHCIIRRFCLELASLLLSCYSLACEESMGGELSGKGLPLDTNCRCIRLDAVLLQYTRLMASQGLSMLVS